MMGQVPKGKRGGRKWEAIGQSRSVHFSNAFPCSSSSGKGLSLNGLFALLLPGSAIGPCLGCVVQPSFLGVTLSTFCCRR